MAKGQKKAEVVTEEPGIAKPVTVGTAKLDLQKRLYALAGDESQAEEFERTRVALEAMA